MEHHEYHTPENPDEPKEVTQVKDLIGRLVNTCMEKPVKVQPTLIALTTTLALLYKQACKELELNGAPPDVVESFKEWFNEKMLDRDNFDGTNMIGVSILTNKDVEQRLDFPSYPTRKPKP